MLLGSIEEAALTFDMETFAILDIAPNCKRITGYTSDELIANPQGWQAYIHPDDRKMLRQNNENLYKGNAVRKHFRFYHRDGSLRWVEVKCIPILDDSSTLVKLKGLLKDITRQKKTNKALMESEHLFRQFFDMAHEAILIFDTETGLYCDYNEAALKLYGLSGTEMLAVSPADLCPEYQTDGSSSSEGIRHYIQQVRDGKRPLFEWTHKKSDGTLVPCEIRLTRIISHQRVLIRASVLDITERKKAEAQVRALNESLERKVADRTLELTQANAQLETFSYTVSHDLQSPMRVVSGFTRIILDEYSERLDEDGRGMLQMINSNALRMNQLIRDLLDFAKLGMSQCHREPVDMDSIVSVVVAEVFIGKPNPNAKVNIGPMVSASCDRILIRQVWVNLLSNALKYSSKKEHPLIEIGSSLTGTHVTYYIRDNGAGFDMKYAQKLFTVFKRMHSQEEFEGTGVGLATVHSIISRHGGRIWAEAVPDAGATFYFTIPVE
jgi:PAS domain S-box-containing protein